MQLWKHGLASLRIPTGNRRDSGRRVGKIIDQHRIIMRTGIPSEDVQCAILLAHGIVQPLWVEPAAKQRRIRGVRQVHYE
jgi:hypothetical protein